MIKTTIICDECLAEISFETIVLLRPLYERSGYYEHVPGGAICPNCRQKEQPLTGTSVELFATWILEETGFDEYEEPEELEELSRRYEALRKCVLAGEPIENKPLQEQLLSWVKIASAEQTRQVGRDLELLADFCLQKSRAARCRLRGDIEGALQYEAVAERAYKQLSPAWKW